MLDRLELNLVSLPEKTYNSVLLLSSSSPSSTPDLNPAILDKVFASMVPGGKWRSRDNLLGGCEKLMLVMAGFLVEEEDGSSVLVKPDVTNSVSLRPRKKGDSSGVAVPRKAESVFAALIMAAPVLTAPVLKTQINGVGFVDYGDDASSDEEFVDPDSLVDLPPLQRMCHYSPSTQGTVKLM